MNAKHSLSTISLIVILLCFAGETGAQTRYDRMLRQNLWNSGVSVNGIRESNAEGAQASLSAGLEHGDFRSPSEGQTEWTVEAHTGAVRHLDKFSMTGAFSFSQNQGYGMCGPMSIEPGYYPIEVWEFTPGTKTLQSYLVDGGISVDLDSNWRLGGRFRMNSRNWSKRKDIRHTNYRLDMDCAAGLMWHEGDFSVEVDGLWGKNAETVSAEQIGTKEASYEAFLDKGQMYGVRELWTGSGIHLKESGVNGLPFSVISYGAAIEAGWRQKLFASVQYRHSNGQSGEKEFIWFRFPADRIDAVLAARSGAHTLRLNLEARRQTNNETVLDKVMTGGVTTVVGYGSNRILVRQNLRICPSYEYESRLLTLGAALDFGRNSSTATQMYPYVTYQTVSTLGAVVSGLYHKAGLEAGGSIGIGRGRTEEAEKRVSDIETGTAPQRYEEGYALLNHYLTAPRADLGLQARWYPRTTGLYVGVSTNATVTLDGEALMRLCSILSIGLYF